MIEISSIRKIDALGRIVLPKQARKLLAAEEGDSVEVLVDSENSQIILRRYGKRCLKCSGIVNLKEIKPDLYLCAACIQDLA